MSKSGLNNNPENHDNFDDNSIPILTPNSSLTSDIGGNDIQTTAEPHSFLPPPLKISPSRARRQLAVRLALKEKERQEGKEKFVAEAASGVERNDDENLTKQSTAIFSPTGGRTSTPDTPAFTAGSKMHERGVHAKRRAAATAASRDINGMTTAQAPEQPITSPIRSEDELSEEEGEEGDHTDDPWASLDSVATTPAPTASLPTPMAKPGPTKSHSEAVSSLINTSLPTPSTQSPIREINEPQPPPPTPNTIIDGAEVNENEEADVESEEVVIAFSSEIPYTSPSTFTPTTMSASSSPSVSTIPTSTPTPNADPSPRPKSPRDAHARGTMSQLFQSWQGTGTGTGTETETGNDKGNNKNPGENGDGVEGSAGV